MKTPNFSTQKEKGQVLVFGAILFLIVLIPLVALVVDGGLLLLNRRQAQAAADAGALAGARKICEKDFGNVVSTAGHYAIAENNAATASVSYSGGSQVKVDTTVSRPSFFISVVGIPDLISKATATAACLVPGNNGLPVAFFCPNPGANNDCGVTMWDLNEQEWVPGTLPPPGTVPLYLIIDTSGLNEDLPENRCPWDNGGTMDCDLDRDPNDGLNPDTLVLGNGQREYVPDICLQQIVPCMNGIIANAEPPASTITLGLMGYQDNAVVDKFYELLNSTAPHLYLFPFYTGYNGAQVNIGGATSFLVTCASRHAQVDDGCPGKKEWLKDNPMITSGARTFEGYFVKNYKVNLNDPGNAGGYNVGTYYVSLIK